MRIEIKNRYVRTADGARVFDQPVGTAIVRDHHGIPIRIPDHPGVPGGPAAPGMRVRLNNGVTRRFTTTSYIDHVPYSGGAPESVREIIRRKGLRGVIREMGEDLDHLVRSIAAFAVGGHGGLKSLGPDDLYDLIVAELRVRAETSDGLTDQDYNEIVNVVRAMAGGESGSKIRFRRHVRTPEGSRQYGQPIGTEIIIDTNPTGPAHVGGHHKPGLHLPSRKPKADKLTMEEVFEEERGKLHAEHEERRREYEKDKTDREAARGPKPATPDSARARDSARAARSPDGTTPARERRVVSATIDAATADIPHEGKPDGTGTINDPIDVGDDLKKAVKLIGEGKHVRINRTDEIGTLLDELVKIVEDAKTHGEKSPKYDLCKVSVEGTNLFCMQSKNINRVNMPQFSGKAKPGSIAEGMMKEGADEANVTDLFRQACVRRGIKITAAEVPANSLKASQDNLDGPKVAGMSKAMEAGKIPKAAIFTTRDGYIIDGHHRWAANVAIDAKDGELGDIMMPVEILDMDIGEALDFANAFADAVGILPKDLGADADGSTAVRTPSKTPVDVSWVPKPGAAKADQTYRQRAGMAS